MSRRKIFYYWLLHVLAALLVLLLQTSLWSRVTMLGLHPATLPFVPAIVATYNDRRSGLLFAVCMGLLCDLTVPDAAPIFYTLSFFLGALCAYYMARRMSLTLLCSLLVCFAAWLTGGVLRLLFLSLRTSFLFGEAVSILLREMLISVLPAVLLHCGFTLLRRYLSRV